MLTVPTLSLLFVLNKNSLPSETLYVLKFFSNSCSDCLNKSPITRADFLDHTHHLLSTPSSEQKGPLGLVFPAHVPCLVTRNSHCSWAGCLLCPGDVSAVSGGTRGTHEVSHTSTATSTPLLTSSLWMGLGVFQGTSPNMSLFSSNPSTAHMRVTKLLCDDCTERILVHSHLPGAQDSYWQVPPRIWGSPGQLSHRAQHPGTFHKALFAEQPKPLCWTDLTLSPSEQDLR